MARLVYEITGDISGLNTAANGAKGILNTLKQQAGDLKLKLFSAETVNELNTIGGAFTNITGKIKEYTDAAIKGSQAFKDQSAQSALDQLSTKLNVIAGNALLFGDSIQNQQSEIKAYQSAINSLFASGLDPLDSRIQNLKSKIDALNSSIESQKASLANAVPSATQQAFDALSARLNVLQGNATIFGQSIQNSKAQISAYQAAIDALLKAGIDPFDVRIGILKRDIDALTESVNKQKQAAAGDPFARYAITGSLITDAERKVRNLGEALRNATDERSIERYNQRLVRAQEELRRLNNLGITSSQQAVRLAGGYNSLGTELARIGQDAPFAFRALGAGSNNFGAIGNNITRLTELIPGYIAQVQASVIAQGQQATSANVARAALTGLVSGFGGVVLAVSLAVSAYTIYSNLQQRAKKEAEEQANAVQKQEQAVRNYIKTLDETKRASADAASNYNNEVSKLDILYNSLIKNTDARYQNTSALKELQKTWPEEFSNLQKGVGFTDQLSASYVRLRENLIQLGIAQAAQSLSADATKRFVENSIALEAALRKEKQASDELNAALSQRNKIEEQNRNRARGNRFNNNVNPDDIISPFQARLKEAQDATADYRIEVFKARQEIQRFNDVAASANSKITTPIDRGLQQQLESQIQALTTRRRLSNDENEIASLNVEIKKKQAALDELLGRNTNSRISQNEKEISLREQLDKITSKATQRAGQSGLEGYALEIKKILDFYANLNRELNKFDENVRRQQSIFNSTSGKRGISGLRAKALLASSNNTRSSLVDPFNKELSDARIKEEKRVSDEITRIQNEFGVKSAESKAKELAQIEARYDAEVAKAKGNAEILAAIDEGRIAAVAAVNSKYEAIQNDLQAKILGIQETTLATLTGREEEQTTRIEKEWENRRAALNGYYADLLKIVKATPNIQIPGLNIGSGDLVSGLLGNKQAQDNTDITNASGKAVTNYLNKDFNNALKGVTRGFVDNLRQGLFNASSQAEFNFKSVFSSITTSFSQTIEQGIFSVLQNQLEKRLQKGIDSGTSGLSKSLQGAIAGAAVAGGLLSGLTSKTSSVGQGLGGALSGAAAGATIGSVIPGLGTLAGGAIGGVVGLVGGLFGASNERKRLQEQQLEEAKKQTELLRQSIAYTSSVIGRMTVNGIVSGVEVNAFGELTTKISGKDLQIILTRATGR